MTRRRREIRAQLAELFFSAESAARRMLLASLGNVASELAQDVQPVATNRALEEAALRRDRAGFTKLLEGALSLSRDQAERIMATHPASRCWSPPRRWRCRRSRCSAC